MALRLKGRNPESGEVDRRYYMIDVQEGGRRERISSGTRNKALAEKKEQLVVDALRADITIPKADLIALVRGEKRAASIASRQVSGPTFREVGKRVCDDVWSKATHSWRHMRSVYERTVDTVGADTPIAAIDADRIRSFIERCRQEKNAPATINRKLSVISVILKRAMDDGIIRAAPRIPRQSGERKRQFVFDEGQFDQMMAAVRARDDREQTVKGGHPIKMDAESYVRFFSVLYETGMRPAEALSLPWENVDFRQGHILVKHAPHKGIRTKTGKSRLIPMTDKCHELLLEVWGVVRKGPFANINHRRANDHWKGARTALGITDIDCVPYATRHSLATRLIEETGDLNQAKNWLGHSTIALTADTYSHVGTKYLSKGADALNARRASAEDSRITRDSVTPETVQSDSATSEKVN